MKIKSIKQAKNISEKKILLRVDFNLPLENEKIQDEQKITATLPTIEYLLENSCSIIIITHLGRPEGRKTKKLSTRPLAKRLGQLIGADRRKNKVPYTEKFNKVKFIRTGRKEKIKEASQALKPGEILFLENLRFNPGEEENNKKFAKELAGLADVYVNDAFSVCHRKHASVHSIKKYLPGYAGLLIEKEIQNLEKIKKPKKPLITIIGGAKIKTKINVITNLQKKSQKILLGGALANNFLAAGKLQVGRSLISKTDIELAEKLKKKIGKEKLILPVDVVVSDRKNGKGEIKVKNIHDLAKKDIILDIGPKTQRIFSKNIKSAQTIIWNGPLGMFENERFKYGTLGVARVVAGVSKGKAFGVVGGGETVQALKQTQMMEYVDWVSTGGGAMLSYLGGEKMPGLEKLIY
ncbi:MAG: phosphoglycerate kinase [Patescibacteria group bacterium]